MCILPVPAYPEKIKISDFLENHFKFRMFDSTYYFKLFHFPIELVKTKCCKILSHQNREIKFQ